MTTNHQKSLHRIFDKPNVPALEVQLLSNGRYHVMVTNGGGGYSRWKDLAVTRWQEDRTCDNWGSFCYLRDLESEHMWSTTYQPTLQCADTSDAVFSAGRATFHRSDHGIETQADIAVSPQDDVEVRRIRLTNHSPARKTLDITSYTEIVLAPSAMDAEHPAFSKLFVETEIVLEHQAILSNRRPRAPHEPSPWMFHLLAAHQPTEGEISYETDRMRFIGRGRTTADPQAMDSGAALSGSAGPVLDPVAAIRCRISLDPKQAAVVDLITGIGETRGVRENGGQYTHAAAWAAMAFAALGDSERAWNLFEMINPINHSASEDAIGVYKTEPYVLASDVYALAPHAGRGGWTWYTGSAGWMYQFILESLLGLRREADQLHFAPCVPADWKSFEVIYRYRKTPYHITVLPHTADGKGRLTIDGVERPGPAIPLVDDRQPHSVEIRCEAASGSSPIA